MYIHRAKTPNMKTSTLFDCICIAGLLVAAILIPQHQIKNKDLNKPHSAEKNNDFFLHMKNYLSFHVENIDSLVVIII